MSSDLGPRATPPGSLFAAPPVDPVLATAQPGELVGVATYCPVHNCDYKQPHASAVVVNEYGVRDVMPKYCRHHRVAMRIERIVEVVR